MAFLIGWMPMWLLPTSAKSGQLTPKQHTFQKLAFKIGRKFPKKYTLMIYIYTQFTPKE